jgi:hypothetical protein
VELAGLVVLADTPRMLVRGRLHRLVVAGLTGMAWLVAPGVADAQVQPHTPSGPPAGRGYVESSFELQASNGYTLSAYRTSGSSDIVLIADLGDERRGRFVTYVIPGTASSTRLHASLAGVAEVDVAFAPRGTTRDRVRKPCTARKPFVVTRGTWEGTIHFAGERGYATADAVRAQGAVTRVPKMRCKDAPRDTALTLSAVSPGETGPVVMATKRRAKLEYAAMNFERSGPVSIVRSVYGRTRGSALTTAGKLSSATLAIPRDPFAGTGTYARTGPDGAPTGTFTGDLSIAFPGLADRVALGGADWTAVLARGSGTQRARLCHAIRTTRRVTPGTVCP